MRELACISLWPSVNFSPFLDSHHFADSALLLILRILSFTPLKWTAAKSSANVIEVSLKKCPLLLTPAAELRTHLSVPTARFYCSSFRVNWDREHL